MQSGENLACPQDLCQWLRKLWVGIVIRRYDYSKLEMEPGTFLPNFFLVNALQIVANCLSKELNEIVASVILILRM